MKIINYFRNLLNAQDIESSRHKIQRFYTGCVERSGTVNYLKKNRELAPGSILGSIGPKLIFCNGKAYFLS